MGNGPKDVSVIERIDIMSWCWSFDCSVLGGWDKSKVVQMSMSDPTHVNEDTSK